MQSRYSQIYMYKSPYKSLVFMALFALFPYVSFAASVHKWVDENGVTHFSDQAPDDSVVQVEQFEISNVYKKYNVEEDYYSISNQWARLHAERLERKKLKLEKAKLKQSQLAATPQVVYLGDEQANRRQVYYPVFANTFGHLGKKHLRSGYRKGVNHYNAAHGKKLLRHNASRSGLKLTIR